MVGRAFVVSKKENIKILTKVNSWFIFNVTSNYNVVRDTSVLVKNLKQLGAINKDINYLFFTGPSPYSEYSQQTMAFSPFAIFKQFLLQLRLPIRTTR